MCLFRAFEDESRARLGVVECAKHELLQPFNVMQEKDGESVIFLYKIPSKDSGHTLSDCKAFMWRV